MLTIQNLTFSYRKDEPLFRDFSLQVRDGSIFGLLAPNGAGKTTLMRLIVDLLQAKQGQIHLFGQTNHRSNTNLRKKLGIMIESPSLYGHLTGRENLKLFAGIFGVSDERVDECLALVNLQHAAGKKFKRYSMGMKQRLSIAATLLHDPELLLLDEPMNGLDPQGIHDVRALLQKLNREENKTIFISSHILSEIESTCTDIGIIKQGKTLFSGTMDELQRMLYSSRVAVIKTAAPESAASVLENDFALSKVNGGLEVEMEKDMSNYTLMKKLVEASVEVDELYNKTNNLESLFLELTK